MTVIDHAAVFPPTLKVISSVTSINKHRSYHKLDCNDTRGVLSNAGRSLLAGETTTAITHKLQISLLERRGGGKPARLSWLFVRVPVHVSMTGVDSDQIGRPGTFSCRAIDHLPLDNLYNIREIQIAATMWEAVAVTGYERGQLSKMIAAAAI